MSKTDYWPENTETEAYLVGEHSLEEILEFINTKWPDSKPYQFAITSENIHCYSLYYDLYDPTDYVSFVKITKES